MHLAEEVRESVNIKDAVLRQRLAVGSSESGETVSGFPAVNAWGSWESFKTIYSTENHNSDRIIKLLVTVEDTGVGIPLDAQGRIFTPFMQADSSTSRTYGGTGIGLSISKRLVELMQGEMGFVSRPGIGSTFSFTGVFGKAETTSSFNTKFDLAIQEFKGLRALVIDSRNIRAEVTRYHLQRLGICADIVSSLRTACTCVRYFTYIFFTSCFAMLIRHECLFHCYIYSYVSVFFLQQIRRFGDGSNRQRRVEQERL